MTTSELVVETDPRPEQVQYLEDRIYEFNSSATGITDGEWLAIFMLPARPAAADGRADAGDRRRRG